MRSNFFLVVQQCAIYVNHQQFILHSLHFLEITFTNVQKFRRISYPLFHFLSKRREFHPNYPSFFRNETIFLSGLSLPAGARFRYRFCRPPPWSIKKRGTGYGYPMPLAIYFILSFTNNFPLYSPVKALRKLSTFCASAADISRPT